MQSLPAFVDVAYKVVADALDTHANAVGNAGAPDGVGAALQRSGNRRTVSDTLEHP